MARKNSKLTLKRLDFLMEVAEYVSIERRTKDTVRVSVGGEVWDCELDDADGKDVHAAVRGALQQVHDHFAVKASKASELLRRNKL